METNWRMFKCKSGEVLFYYNMITGEHRWSNGANIPQCEPDLEIGGSSAMTQLRTVSTQTEAEFPENTQEPKSFCGTRTTEAVTHQYVKKSTIISLLTDIMVVLNNTEHYASAVFCEEPKVIIQKELPTSPESTCDKHCCHFVQSSLPQTSGSVECMDVQTEIESDVMERPLEETNTSSSVYHASTIEGNSDDCITDSNMTTDTGHKGLNGIHFDRTQAHGDKEDIQTSTHFLKSPLAVFEYSEEDAQQQSTLSKQQQQQLQEQPVFEYCDQGDAEQQSTNIVLVSKRQQQLEEKKLQQLQHLITSKTQPMLPTKMPTTQVIELLEHERNETLHEITQHECEVVLQHRMLDSRQKQSLLDIHQQTTTNSMLLGSESLSQSNVSIHHLNQSNQVASQSQSYIQHRLLSNQAPLPQGASHIFPNGQLKQPSSIINSGQLQQLQYRTPISANKSIIPQTSQEPTSSQQSCQHPLSSSSLQKPLSLDFSSRIQDLQCPLCGIAYRTSRDLRIHLNTHVTKDGCCPICGKSYSSKSGLLYHFRNHTGDQPYKCDFCNASFSCSSNFKTHVIRCQQNPIKNQMN